MYEFRHLFAAFTCGCSLGFAFAWAYFLATRLIRTRKEWYADRKSRGIEVPEDWDREDH